MSLPNDNLGSPPSANDRADSSATLPHGYRSVERPDQPLEPGTILAERFSVHRCLGRGGFSDVYLAADSSLKRYVTLKLRYAFLDENAVGANEARTLASAEHANIVPVFDLIEDADFGLMIVMKYISGQSLETRLSQGRQFTVAEAIDLVAQIGSAVQCAHSFGIVHRDIKPGNILIGTSGVPMLTDFGSAARDDDEMRPVSGGTPGYMPPEQMTGGWLALDVRSDVFSLGVVLYRLLTGHLPFPGEDLNEIRTLMLGVTPLHVSSYNSQISEFLDAVCLRAIRKNAQERYQTMEEFVQALLQAQDELAGKKIALSSVKGISTKSIEASVTSHEIPIVRGLKSLRKTDGRWYKELFCEDSGNSGIRKLAQHWLAWLQASKPTAFNGVGILHGVSGSGKTSFVQAGLLSQLEPDIATVTVACEPGNICNRIAEMLGHEFGLVSQEETLQELLERIRLEETVESTHRKVILVLDQFELWVQNATEEQFQTLANALKQCDGSSVQTLIVVDDQNWGDASRLCKLAGVSLADGKNFSDMEWLDKQQAQRVVELMGRYQGTLPGWPEPLNKSQKEFVRSAVDSLARRASERVLPLELAIFGEISSGYHWRSDSLERAGGTDGMYGHYLSSMLTDHNAPLKNSELAHVCAEVLAVMLATSGKPVRATAYTAGEILEKLRNRKKHTVEQVDRALMVLHEQVLAIVPAYSHWRTVMRPDPEDTTLLHSVLEELPAGEKAYRIACDGFVEPMRLWSASVIQSTWQGRHLSDFKRLSAQWNQKRHRGFLPGLFSFLPVAKSIRNIELNPREQDYWRSAKKAFALQVAMIAGFCLLLGWGLRKGLAEHDNAIRARTAAVTSELNILFQAPNEDVAEVIQRMLTLDIRDELIREASREQSRERDNMRAVLFRAQYDDSVGREFSDYMAEFDIESGPAIVNAVLHSDRLQKELEALLELPNGEKARYRAAICLAHCGDMDSLANYFRPDTDANLRYQVMIACIEWKQPEFAEQVVTLLSSRFATTRYAAVAILGSLSQPELSRVISANFEEMESLQAKSDTDALHAQWLFQRGGFEPELPPESSRVLTLNSGMRLKQVEVVKQSKEFGERVDAPALLQPDVLLPQRSSKIWVTTECVNRGLYHEFLAEDGAEAILREESELPSDAINLQRVSPLRVIEFCNWISAKEGLECRYSVHKSEDGVEFTDLQTNGFRPPTREELSFLLFGRIPAAQPHSLASRVYCSHQGLDFGVQATWTKELQSASKSTLPSTDGIHCLNSLLPLLTFDGEFWAYNPILPGGVYPYKIQPNRKTQAGILIVRDEPENLRPKGEELASLSDASSTVR